MFRTFAAAIFPHHSDKGWTWRRRMAFTGAAVFLFGIIHAIRFEPDKAWASVVLLQCIGGWVTTMGIYYGGSYADKKLQNEQQKAE